MNKYLYISSHTMGNESIHGIVEATTWYDALRNVYKYIGGSLSVEAFEQTVEDKHMTSENAFKLFEILTGETILFFGLANFSTFVDRLNRIN